MDANAASVLLFEQNLATRQLYARELGKHWRVSVAEDAAGCLEMLARDSVQAVICELETASDEEWSLLTQIVQMTASAHTPVIVCSAVDARGRGYASGVSTYLVKPVLPQQLIAEVARWLHDEAHREEPTRGDYVGTITDSKPVTAPND
jgi:DNA-binding NtrC family response regulator